MNIFRKTVVLTVLFLGLPGFVHAAEKVPKTQSAGASSAARPSADLAKSLAAYRQVTMQMDVDGMLAFIYPAVFNLVPREMIKTSLAEMLASGNAPVIKALDIGEVGPVRRYSKGQFAIVNYQLEIELPRPGDATPEIDKKMIEVLKSKMGADTQIAIDEQANVLTVSRKAVLLAINEGQAGWTVLEKQRLTMIREAGLLPDDLLAQLQ